MPDTLKLVVTISLFALLSACSSNAPRADWEHLNYKGQNGSWDGI